MGKPEYVQGRAMEMWRQRQEAIARRWAEEESARAASQTITLPPDQYTERKDDDT